MIKDSQYADQIDVITYENFQGSLQDVSNGRLDAVLNDRLAALTAVNESGLDLQLAGEPLEVLSNAFPFVKNDSNK
jgi:putative amino-acid transport system substrate-binding protein/putative amino-acid transport system permease protein